MKDKLFHCCQMSHCYNSDVDTQTAQEEMSARKSYGHLNVVSFVYVIIFTLKRPSLAAGPFSAICNTNNDIFWNSRPPLMLNPNPKGPLVNSTA